MTNVINVNKTEWALKDKDTGEFYVTPGDHLAVFTTREWARSERQFMNDVMGGNFKVVKIESVYKEAA